MAVVLRPASHEDVNAIVELCRATDGVLERTASEISEGIYFLAIDEDGAKERVVGCAGLKVWDEQAEVISLIVVESHRGKRIAPALLEQCKIAAADRGLELFTITHKEAAKRVFIPAGFKQTALENFEAKVLSDCAKCPENVLLEQTHNCSDSAYVLDD